MGTERIKMKRETAGKGKETINNIETKNNSLPNNLLLKLIISKMQHSSILQISGNHGRKVALKRADRAILLAFFVLLAWLSEG